MKNLLKFSLLMLFFVFASQDVNAQRGSKSSDGGKTQAIKTNPLGLAFNFYNATYERSLKNPRSSFLVGATIFTGVGDADVFIAQLGVGYRYYITKGGLTGFYVNPKVGYGIGTDESDISVTQLVLAVELGYQIMAGEGFVFDIGIGPARRFIGGDSSSVSTGSLPSATLAIGYAF